MPPDDVPPNAAWLQWAITTVLGIFMAVYGFALARLFSSTEKLRDNQDQIREVAGKVAASGDADIWEALEKLRTAMELDRREAAVDRQHIAANMLTRVELIAHEEREFTMYKEQTDRVIAVLHNRRRTPIE